MKAGDTLPLKGNVSILVLAGSGEVIDVPDAPANPLYLRAPDAKLPG